MTCHLLFLNLCKVLFEAGSRVLDLSSVKEGDLVRIHPVSDAALGYLVEVEV